MLWIDIATSTSFYG